MSGPSKSKAETIDARENTERSQERGQDTPRRSPVASGTNASPSWLEDDGDGGSPPLDSPSRPQKTVAAAEASRRFLTNFKNRIIQENDQRHTKWVRPRAKAEEEYGPASGSVSTVYHLRQDGGSTPELSLVGEGQGGRRSPRAEGDDAASTSSAQQQPRVPSPHQGEDKAPPKDKNSRNLLGRSGSDGRASSSKASASDSQLSDLPLRTAPLNSDWQATSEMLQRVKDKDRKRGKSADRNQSQERLPKPSGRSAFTAGRINVISKAKTGGNALFGRLGKIARSSNHNEREVPDGEYVLKVINLPLIEQTRITRISKDLSSCRDKTEYWMPSLPWRCIDYLNLNCEAEGLYRIPGSGPQVKHWQRRFDTELDVDLLDEQDLYDPNNIGSMLKSWLRDLPTEIFPKDRQAALAEELARDNPNYHRMGEKAPEKLRDALSQLPPFNYYLLFAITCHLSLLLSHKEKNKMDLNNLSICIGPCLELDRWLFNYLVGDWRRCWQGCFTEKEWLDGERLYEQGVRPAPGSGPAGPHRQSEPAPYLGNASLDERAVHSSGSGVSTAHASRSGSGSHSEDPPRLPPRVPSNGSSGNIARKPVPTQARPSMSEVQADTATNETTRGPTRSSSSIVHGRSRSDFAGSPTTGSFPEMSKHGKLH